MAIGAMFGDIFKSLFKRPVTELYPFQRKPAPERLRGKLVWDPSKCTGCQLCVKDCPANAIELIVLDKVAKKFVMRYNEGRCTFCQQCVVNCRFGCLQMSNQEWELATLDRKPLEIFYGKDEDVQFLLEQAARAETGDAKCGA